MFGEPPRSPYDINFRLFGIPVRVHPLFWLVGLFLGMSAPEMSGMFLWVAALFIAILVHEFGHALTMRHYGLQPWVVLYGMGGLACYSPDQLSYSRANTSLRQILISLAGPGAGFVLAIVLMVASVAAGYGVSIFVGARTVLALKYIPGGPFLATVVRDTPFVGVSALISGITAPIPNALANHLLFIGLAWGLINLLPVYPLDGGQISREIFVRFNPRQGIRYSLILSVVTAGVLAALFLLNVVQTPRGEVKGVGASLLVPILFGYLAYSSYATLQAYDRYRSGW
ncbi:MAG TPA: hypothetical protein DD670_12625 [Planctomycetaceae bacterium]|nr:hypothetical protein [Planctomycetaceae bacterium]